MSKSKGNVVNPLQVADEYGADAVRFALVYGTALGNDQAMSYGKLDAAKKFANKLWNMGRFIEFQIKENGFEADIKIIPTEKGKEENRIHKKQLALSKAVSKYIKDYKFNLATEALYEFIWHDLADKYIEYVKTSKNKQQSFAVLIEVYKNCLRLLHPFMPFITEAIYQQLFIKNHLTGEQLGSGKESLMIDQWPI